MVEVFREVRRVLRKDGTCWLNIGDSYNAYNGNRSSHGRLSGAHRGHPDLPPGYGKNVKDLKAKDLCLIPAHLAIALQADGWWVRSEIVWDKPNPMPESVTDRPTSSHEKVWLLTKSGTAQFWTHDVLGTATRPKPKPDYWWFPPPETLAEPSHEPVEGWKRRNAWRGHDYFYDQDAVREPYQYDGRKVTTRPSGEGSHENHRLEPGERRERWPGMKPRRSGNLERKHGTDVGAPNAQAGDLGRSIPWEEDGSGRNLRNVWRIATRPTPEAHFAVFPEELPRTCILAGTSERGCCSGCGAPWVRATAGGDGTYAERKALGYDKPANMKVGEHEGHHNVIHPPGFSHDLTPRARRTIGWNPSCGCELEPVPAVVFDPFGGFGTTGLAARKQGRRSVLIELSADYCDLIAGRTQQLSLEASA